MKKKSKFRSVLQWIGKNKLFTLGIIIVGIYLLAGIFAPLIARRTRARQIHPSDY